MKTITVITPANIEVEYRLAGAGSRLAAFTVDFLLQSLACLALAALVLFGLSGLSLSTLSEAGGYSLAFLIIMIFVIYFGYFIVCEMLMNGQSIGKKLLGLRVIRDNGQPIGLVQSLIRNLFRIALDMLYVGIFVILFSKKHKRVGDMAAGTLVISEHYENVSSLLPTKDGQHNHLTLKFSHITLTEEERRILNAYLRRRDQLPDKGKSLQKQFALYFSEKWSIDASLFDGAVLERIVGM